MVSSFEYGKKYPKWAIVAGAVLAVCGVILIVIFCISSDNFDDLRQYVPIFSFALLSLLVGLCFSVLMCKHNLGLEQKLHLWIQDAVQVEGVMTRNNASVNPRFEITIKYNGEEKIFVTPDGTTKEFPLRNMKGFQSMCGSTIPVLYSPKYNQVMFVDASNCEEIL